MRQYIHFGLMACLGWVSAAHADLISHWALDETSGSVAGNEISGAPVGYVGGGLVWTVGPVEGAAEFNGSNARIYIPTSLGSSGNWTWVMWLRYDSVATNYDSILSTNAWALGTGMHGVLRSNGAFAVGLNTGGADDQTQSQGTLSPGAWNHIAWTYDASAAQAKFYINGELDVTRTVAQPITMTMGSSTLGAWNVYGTNSYERWLDGGLDDVRIYNQTLTEADIQALYLGPTRATHPSPVNNHPGADPAAILNWQAPQAFPAGATYNVYLAGNSADLPSSLPLVSAAQIETSYTPALEPGVQYWWRIDVIAPDATIYTGDLWTFTTIITPEGCYAYPSADFNGDCRVDLTDMQRMAGEWMVCRNVPACVSDEEYAGSLLAHWKFDNTLTNETGEALNGVGVPANPVYAAGMDGQSLDLQGYNAVNIPEIGTNDAFTITFWVNFDTFEPTGAAMPIISTNHSSGEIMYGLAPNGGLFYPAVALTVSPIGGPTATYATGQWYHFAQVYNRSNGSLDLYIDGRLVSTSGYPTACPMMLGPLTLGARNNDGVLENVLDGKIDDLRVYGHALSAVQIATLYTILRPAETICVQFQQTDMNRDCVVDFADFALFASDWLNCRLVPDCMALP